MPITEVAAGVGILKNVYDLVRGLRRSDSLDEVKAGLSEVIDRLIDAQAEVIRLGDETAALKAKLDSINRFEDQKEQYACTRAPGGAFVHVVKASAESDPNAPCFCPKCFTDKTLSMLQPKSGGKQECPNCKSKFQVEPPPKGSVWVV